MDCSAIGLMSSFLRASLAMATVFGAACASAATLAELDDTLARIQYGFLTSDARAIERALQDVASYDTEERLAPLRSYQLAYGHWKLAQVAARTEGAQARTRNAAAAKAARSCVEHARDAYSLDERMAEAYALEAVCSDMPRGFLRMAGLTGSCARSRPLRTALTLEPANPRILLIEAMCTGGKDAAGGVARWRKVVDAFARASATSAGKPDWGEAEALVMLGEHHLQRGEVLAAREALERALILAPDYDAAKELLAATAQRAH